MSEKEYVDIKLRPCPFCGRKVNTKASKLVPSLETRINCFECPRCGAYGPFADNNKKTQYEYWESALKRWNSNATYRTQVFTLSPSEGHMVKQLEAKINRYEIALLLYANEKGRFGDVARAALEQGEAQ